MAVDRERLHQKHRQMIMAKYEGICHICEEPYADAIDHVVPVAKGGSDHPDNLRPAHTACNSKKGAKSYPKWAEDNPRMWIAGHEPKAIKEKQAREKAAIAKEERAKDKQRKQVQSAIDEAKTYVRRLMARAEREAPEHNITRILPNTGYMNEYVRGNKEPGWIDGDAQTNSRIWLKYSNEKTINPREQEANSQIVERFPNIFLLSVRTFWGGRRFQFPPITFETGLYGTCGRCKRFVTYSRDEGWSHKCSWAMRRSRHISAEY